MANVFKLLKRAFGPKAAPAPSEEEVLEGIKRTYSLIGTGHQGDVVGSFRFLIDNYSVERLEAARAGMNGSGNYTLKLRKQDYAEIVKYALEKNPEAAAFLLSEGVSVLPNPSINPEENRRRKIELNTPLTTAEKLTFMHSQLRPEGQEQCRELLKGLGYQTEGEYGRFKVLSGPGIETDSPAQLAPAGGGLPRQRDGNPGSRTP